MIKETYNNERALIPGRAGEIVATANPLTFSLLVEIFGKKGPVREVLRDFGIRPSDNDDTFLVLEKDRVLTDLDKENDILWGSLPIKYKVKDGKVVQKTNLDLTKLPRLLAKSFIESKYIANVKGTEDLIFSRFEKFCELEENVYYTGFADTRTFLDAYKEVVFISYIYEILFAFNDTDKDDLHPSIQKKLSAYAAENDYLLRTDEPFAENIFKVPGDFCLGQDISEVSAKPQLIPGQFPQLKFDDKNGGRFILETELQCIKNTLRLKTGLILYFLNKHLWERANKKGFNFIADKNITELEG